jgi:hypothetical protein|tara:strand:- start:70 stop:306 length:237 start_codon:yes stop_codon:yes gene_type:complete
MKKHSMRSFRNKSPKIISLLEQETNSPRTPSPPKSGKKKLGEVSPVLCHIERCTIEKFDDDDENIPLFNLNIGKNFKS